MVFSQIFCCQASLYNYLLNLKLLLAKSRKILITDAGIEDHVVQLNTNINAQTNVNMNANNVSQLQQSHNTAVEGTSVSTGSILASLNPSSSAVANLQSRFRKDNAANKQPVPAPTPPIEQHILWWQVDLERLYDTIVDNTIVFLTDVEGLKKLRR
jgi:hypothetical protein